MKPWYDVLGVDEHTPWPLIEYAYLDKWAALKAKAFPTEAENQQLEELERAFREAKHNRRESPALTDASLPDGTKPVRQIPEKPEEIPPPETKNTINAPSAEYAPSQALQKDEAEDSTYLSGCGLAILFIVGVAVVLLALLGLGVSPGYAGLIIVFGLPFLLYFGDRMLKKRKQKQ